MNITDKIYFSLPAWGQEKMLSLYAMYRDKRFRRNKHFKDAVLLVEQISLMTPEELEVWQLQQLRKIVAYAINHIPFYQNYYRGLDCDFQSIEDFKMMPTIEKNQVRVNWQEFQGSVEGAVFKSYTSGTTGSSLLLRITAECNAIERAGFYYARKMGGYQHGNKLASFIGRKIMDAQRDKPPFWRYNKYDNQLIFSNWHVSEANLSSYIKKYNQFAPEFVNGYPSFLYLLSEFVLRNGLTLVKPKAIFTGSETLLPNQRSIIEMAFGAKVFDHYGTSEHLVVAHQCVNGIYHLREELGFLEIIDGTVYGTTFWNTAMPLIRYKIGDASELKSLHCDCGVTGRVLVNLQGRLEDVIISNTGKKYGRLDHLFKNTNDIKEAQIVQKTVEQLLINIVPANPDNFSLIEIEAVIRNKLGREFEITFNILKEIPRTTGGKFRFIISEINKP